MPVGFRATLIAGLMLAAAQAFAEPGPDSINRFDIPAQELGAALLEFGRQSGYSIVFEAELTEGKQSRGVRGNYRNRVALERLLDHSSLGVRFIDDRSVAILPGEHAAAASGEQVAGIEPSPAGNPVDSEADARRPGGDDETRSRDGRVEEVIVVGSQLAGANVSDALPVTIWDLDRIDALGAIDTGDLFRALPFAGAVNFNGVDTFFAGVNSARGDISSINLRDLGTGNTLVLLNGRRMAVHPGVQTESRVPAMTANMNVLPILAMQRIEVLRDGASAVYGTDAVAGVINNVLKAETPGFEATAQYGAADTSSLAEINVGLRAGFESDDGARRLQLIASLTDRRGYDAADLAYARSSNLQPLLAGTRFADDADFNNNSIVGTWGQFELSVPVNQDGVPLTSPGGLFHLQPSAYTGCLADAGDGVCIDDGFIDEELYGDTNSVRQLMPDLRRLSMIATASSEISDRLEVFGELLFYDADSRRTTGGGAPLPSTPVTIPADNYWNPFGPEFFADGRVNPNRLPGLDAPASGLPIAINSSYFGTAYRISDVPDRVIDVENFNYRVLAGFRGRLGTWSWDSALLNSESRTHDVTSNRVSNTLFQRSLMLDTPSAYNAFNGSDPVNPGRLVDTVPNPPSVTAPFLMSVYRDNETSLTLADFKLSNPEVHTLQSGPVGISAGIEMRREGFREDRDPHFDGTITFTDQVTGIEYDSDIMGTSVTTDSSGSRDVVSLFGEFVLPVFGEAVTAPLIDSLDIQLAARYEDYSDVGDSFQPRLSFALQTNDAIKLRGSWSQGVRVPNLPQLNPGTTRRVLTATDWYRCQALVNKGLIASLASCGAAGRVFVESSRSGSQDLEPEDYESTSFGLVFTPRGLDELLATVDFWRVEQVGIVGLFGAENQVAVDYSERLQGRSNPLVERAALTPNDVEVYEGSGLPPAGEVLRITDSYLNLDRRVSSGIDLSLSFDTEINSAGSLHLAVDATRLLEADQSLSEPAQAINDLDEPAIAVMGAGDLRERDGRPLWKAAAYAGFNANTWRAALTANYISGFDDTSAIDDETGDFFRVDHWLTAGMFVEKQVSLLNKGMNSIRLGVRNMFNAEPPLADETFGYNAAMHDSFGRYWYLRLGAEF